MILWRGGVLTSCPSVPQSFSRQRQELVFSRFPSPHAVWCGESKRVRLSGHTPAGVAFVFRTHTWRENNCANVRIF